MESKRRIKGSDLFICAVFIFIYLPVFIVVLYSFNESRLSSVWGGFSFAWYERLISNPSIMEALKNSIILAVNTSILSAIIGTAGAYGMHMVKGKKAKKLELTVILPMLIPEIILGMVFLAFFTMLDLPFGMVTLTLAHTAICFPFVYMLVKTRLLDMDKSVLEVAYTLGASKMRAFKDITFPYLLPSVVAGMLLSFATSMDNVIVSIFVTGVNVNTLPMKVYTQIKVGITPEINALCTLMIVVTLLLFSIAGLIIIKLRKSKGKFLDLNKHNREEKI